MTIDTHVHFLPAPLNSNYLTWLDETKNMDFGPASLWNDPAFENIDTHLAEMTKYQIDQIIVTYSANVPLILSVSKDKFGGRDGVIRYLNDALLKVANAHPQQIIPLAYIDPTLGMESIQEMDRVKHLGFKGLAILTDYQKDGHTVYLDDPIFADFWQKAAELNWPIFMHFASHFNYEGAENRLNGFMNNELQKAGVGQLLEDSIAITRIALSGIFDQYPNLKIISGQLGGVLPMLYSRLTMLYNMYADMAKNIHVSFDNQRDSTHYLRNFVDYKKNIYVDIHSMDKASIEFALQVLGKDHIVFGSDYPITPTPYGRQALLKTVSELAVTPATREKILATNIQSILPN